VEQELAALGRVAHQLELTADQGVEGLGGVVFVEENLAAFERPLVAGVDDGRALLFGELAEERKVGQ
jgi:hypothetical protein